MLVNISAQMQTVVSNMAQPLLGYQHYAWNVSTTVSAAKPVSSGLGDLGPGEVAESLIDICID